MMKTRYGAAALLVCVFALSGCGAVVVAGAAAGGYYVGKDERTMGTIAEDASITASINAKFANDGVVKMMDINVDTYAGVVTLYGSVHSQLAADRAVTLAKSVKGVKQVVSKLTVVPKG